MYSDGRLYHVRCGDVPQRGTGIYLCIGDLVWRIDDVDVAYHKIEPHFLHIYGCRTGWTISKIRTEPWLGLLGICGIYGSRMRQLHGGLRYWHQKVYRGGTEANCMYRMRNCMSVDSEFYSVCGAHRRL